MFSVSSKCVNLPTPATRNFNLRHLVMLCVIAVGFSICSLAQQATIVGTVTDPSGAVVPKASITVTSVGTGETRKSETNDAGQYVVPSLPIGQYNVSAKAAGFGDSEKNGLVLNVDDRDRVDFVLKVGSQIESVTVEATAVAVQSDSGEVSTVINGNQVSELGTNGRSILSLYALSAGAASLQTDLIIPVPVGGDNNVSINGQRAGHNLQILDGSENLDRGGSGPSVIPSLDAIEEFRSLNSNYSAEYGLTSAAVITNAIKSGTKTFHASAWEFDRNDALDARNYFNRRPAKVSELRFNVYGFNVGGQVPVAKSHPTFFFYNMEWRSLVQGGLLNRSVPLADEYPDAGGAGTGAVFPTTYNGKASVITVPTGVANLGANCPGGVLPAGIVPGTPFPGNTIPDCLIDDNARALMAAGIFPKPTSGAQFQGGNNSPTKVKEEIARVDHQFTDKFSVFGHWVSEQISQTYGTTQWSDDNVPTISDVFGNPSYSAVVHTTYVVSPALLNEAAFNYNGNRINIIPKGVITAPTGAPGVGFQFNRLFTGPNVSNRIPGIYLSGITGSTYTSNWTPWINKADDYQFRDDVSWTKGAHQLKMGFSWAIYKKIQDFFADTQGTFRFDGGFTGYDLGDFLLGTAHQYGEDAVKSSGHWNNLSYAAYVQDTWRVNHRLTVNLGLRWDGAPHTYEANQQSANFYPSMYDFSKAATFDSSGNICSGPATATTNINCAAASPGLGTSSNPILAGLQFYTNGIGIGGKGGIPKGLAKTYWPAFGPRLGFAYDLTGQGKTVIRGGFGINYDRIQGNDLYNGATNPPSDASPTLFGVALANPGTNLANGQTITAANLPILPLGVTGVALNYKPPTSYQYSAGVQQSISSGLVLGLSYVGNKGRNLNDYRVVNLPPLSSLPALLAAKGAGLNQQVTYPGFGNIRLSENEGNSSFDSFQVDLHGQVSRDLQLQFGYTVARAVDSATSNGSGGDLNNLSNPYAGWQYDSGPSVYDRTNVAFVNYVYRLPFFRSSNNRFTRAVAGGWELSGIITVESGAPLNITLGSNTGGNGNVANFISNTSNRPDVIGNVSYSHAGTQWFDPSSFSQPACLTGPDCYGNLRHNVVRGPGRDNWNLSLNKDFVLSAERGSRIEFRAESYNTWNHTQFKGDYNNTGIDTNFSSGTFGQVQSAFDPRVFQIGLKVIY